MYDRAKKEFDEFIDASPTETETSLHRHTLRSDLEKSFLGELKCIFCTKYDDLCNLMAAGTYHASQKKVNTTHLKELETKWRKWASCLYGFVHVVTALSMGDLAANELYYHKVCYSDFYNAYCRQQTQSGIETDEQWFKSISFNKIISYLYEKESESPGTIFYVKQLEEIYISLLKCHNIDSTSHVTRFSDSLLQAIPDLKKSTVSNKLTVCFKGTINMLLKHHVKVPDDFTRSIRDVVVPIRNSMKIVKNKFDGSFKNECQKDSVPIELLVLISMLVDGVGIENQGFSQETLTISQLVMYNFSNRKIVADRKYSNKRHPQHLETPLPTYISLKIYATVRSKTLIDSLFSLGICLPYSRVLEITKDIGIKTLNKYEINDCFVPDNIKNGIFTVVAKDNIDLNARCTIVKSHFHGISMSVLQFPSYFNPGQSQEYNIVKEGDFVSTFEIHRN